MTFDVRVASPVPPLGTMRTPLNTIAPLEVVAGVRPVVPPLKLVTPVAGAADHYLSLAFHLAI